MSVFREDFDRSPALCLACSASSEFAARTYCDYGFAKLYPGENGDLALVKPPYATFAALEAAQFADPVPARVRPGVQGDQFRIDKFLAYSRAFHDAPPKSQFLDYRSCMLETLGGNGAVAVAENASGALLGFAWAGKADGLNRLTFLIHPAACESAGPLLLQYLRGRMEQTPVCLLEPGDGRGRRTRAAAAGKKLCTLPGGAELWTPGGESEK